MPEEALSVEPGKGILDCGATRPVIGELTWHLWLQAIRHLGREAEVKYANVVRTFKYGNGECLTAKYEVSACWAGRSW